MGERTYQAKTMKEALSKVRRDLGGDAIILASREIRRRRLLGLGSRDLIQITASATMPAAPSTAAVAPPDQAVVQALREPSQGGLSISGQPPLLVSGYAQLQDADVPELLAGAVVQLAANRLEPDQTRDLRAVHDVLCQAIGECIAIAPPCMAVAGTRRVVALVGPTGVGKTTTVAKLAAGFKLAQGFQAGLVTVDTYRIAAVEQLKTYANIMEIPLAVVQDPCQIRQAIEELGAVDLVFIDTAGRSPRDEARVHELQSFLDEARPDEVHLVLSAASAERTLQWAIDQFARVGVDRLILTKLDEARTLGVVLGVLSQANLPVSYVTTGQAVPEDIELADRRKLARLVLGLEQIRCS